MQCPSCGHVCGDSDRFCSQCGAALLTILDEQTDITGAQSVCESANESCLENVAAVAKVFLTDEIQTEPIPVPKRKKHPVLIPCLVMLLMFAVGFSLFLCDYLPAKVEAAANTVYQEGCFLLQNGVLSFDGSLYDGSPVLEVPSTIGGKQVTTIGNGCFQGCMQIEEIILPDGITGIGYGAFSGCKHLRGIYLPEGVTSIGEKAFWCCISLESIVVPASVNRIGTNCFSRCDSLHYIFYGGNSENWFVLYNEEISDSTYISAQDGLFRYSGS